VSSALRGKVALHGALPRTKKPGCRSSRACGE
jgi:hypothetical protein